MYHNVDRTLAGHRYRVFYRGDKVKETHYSSVGRVGSSCLHPSRMWYLAERVEHLLLKLDHPRLIRKEVKSPPPRLADSQNAREPRNFAIQNRKNNTRRRFAATNVHSPTRPNIINIINNTFL